MDRRGLSACYVEEERQEADGDVENLAGDFMLVDLQYVLAKTILL